MIFRIPLYSLAMMLAVFPMQVLAIDPVLQQEQLEQARQQATLRDDRLQSRPFSVIPVHDIPVPTEESPQSGPSFLDSSCPIGYGRFIFSISVFLYS